jgi:hypothetical protein
MAERYRSYEEFWPFYVAQHRNPANRGLHFIGTTLVLACALLAIWTPWFLAAAPVAGYGFAWVGHFFFEQNRPATFTYPVWSLRGDFRMYRLMLFGRVRPELERARLLFPSGA